MPIYGFLPATDPRMRSTIEAIARDLTEDGLVLRYRAEEGLNADGLTGEEGTFVICSFWLVSCLAQAGEVERAEALFEQLAGYANDLGLLGEEIDTANGEQLGNFPQAYSHIGLITAAYEIDKARGAGMTRLRRHRARRRARRASTAPRGSPPAACAWRSSSASCSAASAPTGAASRPRRCCGPGEALQAAREAPGAREAVAGRVDVGRGARVARLHGLRLRRRRPGAWADGEGIEVLRGAGRLDGPGPRRASATTVYTAERHRASPRARSR